MDINLQSIEAINRVDPERAIFNIFKATLQYPASPQAKYAKIADDIKFCCTSQVGGVSEVLWEIWTVILDIASCIPSGHPWQDSLVQSLERLRRMDEAVPQYHEVRDAHIEISARRD